MELARSKAASGEFERFAAEVSDALLRTGFLIAGNAADAEDLVQETLLKVARRWGRVRSMEHPAAYARQILVNLLVRGARRRARQQSELQPRQQEAAVAGLADHSAAQAIRQIDDRAEFGWALAQLPTRQRAVLVLRYWSDLPVAEVAALLGCTQATVTSTTSRAAARLAQILTPATPHT